MSLPVVPYGAWPSPVSPSSLTQGSRGLGQIQLDDGDLYWAEGRPDEAGRVALVRRRADGVIDDLLPAPWNVRSRVHEYGGGAFRIVGGTAYVVAFPSQRIWRVPLDGGDPSPLTADDETRRYADMVADAEGRRLIAVCEDHGVVGLPANLLVGIDLASGEITALASGADFYLAPRVSRDGTMLAWLEWDLPDMPWDGCRLMLAEINDDGTLGTPTQVAGSRHESICQPAWSPGGDLVFSSDRSGWWNLYRAPGPSLLAALDGAAPSVAVTPLLCGEFEVGAPAWVFDQSDWAFAGESIVAIKRHDGQTTLVLVDPAGAEQVITGRWTEIAEVRADAGRVVIAASDPAQPSCIAECLLPVTGPGPLDAAWAVLRRSRDAALPVEWVSRPQPIRCAGGDGDQTYAYLYLPVNPTVLAPDGELPPLRLMTHGGPTSRTGSGFNLGIQFWTSRGFAVADVDYRGSTGYGTAYRRALDGQWGIADVEDVEAVVSEVVTRGLVDPARVAIQGGSAGGYTTLAALTFGTGFTAGASYYGIGDLEALARDTHKFESRYLDRLVGPYPEARDVYLARSPIHHTDRLAVPLVLLQGLDDAVVPPNQAREMAAAVEARGLPVELIEFEGEGHGFRKAETIEAAARAELAFYGRVFGFTPAPEQPSASPAGRAP